MLETQVLSLDQEDPLERQMATHSSILAWEILWTCIKGRLYTQSPILNAQDKKMKKTSLVQNLIFQRHGEHSGDPNSIVQRRRLKSMNKWRKDAAFWNQTSVPTSKNKPGREDTHEIHGILKRHMIGRWRSETGSPGQAFPLPPPQLTAVVNGQVWWDGIWSHHFMANRWANSGNTDRLYSLGLQNHCRWWLQPWN